MKVFKKTDVLDLSRLDLANQDNRLLLLYVRYNEGEKDEALRSIAPFIDEYKNDGWEERSELVSVPTVSLFEKRYVLKKSFIYHYKM